MTGEPVTRKPGVVRCFVADIGGTHARCGLVTEGKTASAPYRLTRETTYDCAQLTDIYAMLDNYSSDLGGTLPKEACIAIAGPVNDGRVRMTNLDWQFTREDLKSRFKLQNLEIINDFEAVASAVPHLDASSVCVIKPGSAVADTPLAVLGAGTGLGVAALVPVASGWKVIASEGGHGSLAAETDLELEIMARLRSEHGHVSAEMLLSGPGLARLYHTLSEVRSIAADDLPPEEITRRALDEADRLCGETVDVFCDLLGSFAGNLALTYGATGGVYLSGRIFRFLQPLLAAGGFARRFENKGAMRDYVTRVPVFMMELQQPGLVGAAAWLRNRHAGERHK